MNKISDQLLARRTRLGKRTSLVGGIAAIAIAVIVGTVAVVVSFASNEQLYLAPANGTVLQGNTIAVAIRVNSGADTVNAVQANLSYDPTQLQFQSIDPSGTAFGLEASTITTPAGVIQLARATSGGSPAVSGDNLFATVTFKALAGTGSAIIKIDTGSHVVRSTDATDILATSAGSTLTLTSAGGTVSPTPTPSKTPTPSNSPGTSPSPSASGSPTPVPSNTPVFYTGKLTLTPAAVSIASGANVTFDIMEDSGTSQVNAIQANLAYDPALLQYVGADATGTSFPLNAVTATGNGSVKLTRALNGGDPAVTGSHLVARVTFKVLASSGTVPVSYDTGSVISTIDGLNALVSSTGAIVTVTGGGGTTPTPQPGTGGGITPTPTVPQTQGGGGNPVPVTVVPSANPVVTIPVVGGNGSIKVTGKTKLTAPSIPANATIAYAVDNQATTPVIDTTTLDNGTHTVTATATDPATGTSQVVKQKIDVQNTQPLWKTLLQGAKASWPYLLIILSVVALAVGLWLFMRRLSEAPEVAPQYADGMREGSSDNLIHPTEPHDPSDGPTGPLGF